MKTSIKLLIAGIILLFLTPFWIFKLIGIICILGSLLMGFKNFLFELIDHIKGTPGRSSEQGYRDEARKACERVTPKQKQNTTPPWEE